MAKKASKKVSKEPKQDVEETTEVIENELTTVSSSSSDDSEAESDDIEGLSSADEDENESTHKIKKLDPKKKTQKKTDRQDSTEYSSIIYVSRLPHGFHERELSKYFSQFGDLKEVKLARNRKSGNSRHYGFVEFANKDDAKIAQETMNNYLIMGHLLQVRLLPKGSKIEKLYKYKKRAFRESSVKKSADELKDRAKAKHDDRMQKLEKAGIQFTW